MTRSGRNCEWIADWITTIADVCLCVMYDGVVCGISLLGHLRVFDEALVELCWGWCTISTYIDWVESMGLLYYLFTIDIQISLDHNTVRAGYLSDT